MTDDELANVEDLIEGERTRKCHERPVVEQAGVGGRPEAAGERVPDAHAEYEHDGGDDVVVDGGQIGDVGQEVVDDELVGDDGEEDAEGAVEATRELALAVEAEQRERQAREHEEHEERVDDEKARLARAKHRRHELRRPLQVLHLLGNRECARHLQFVHSAVATTSDCVRVLTHRRSLVHRLALGSHATVRFVACLDQKKDCPRRKKMFILLGVHRVDKDITSIRIILVTFFQASINLSFFASIKE